jgi:diaminopimelate epimerase
VQVKYTTFASLGRKVHIVDELNKSIVPESIKDRFSAEYGQLDSRLGGDLFCYLQKVDDQVIQEIEEVHYDYRSAEEWKKLKKQLNSEISAIVRFFSPMGWEVDFCADGLRCAAAYLSKRTKSQDFNLLTGITSAPKVRRVQATWRKGIIGTEVDVPTDPPASSLALEAKSCPIKEDNLIYVLPSDPIPITHSLSMKLTSFVTFCNGLHMIAFCGPNQPANYIEKGIEGELCEDFFKEAINEQDLRRRKRMFRIIGRFFNNSRDPYFPKGIDLSFVGIGDSRQDATIWTYDHLVQREVKSHGNAAAASSIVAHELNLLDGQEVNIFPNGSFEILSFRGEKTKLGAGHFRVVFDKQKVFLEGPVQRMGFGTIMVGE